MTLIKSIKCCATCKNFEIVDTERPIKFRCARLGYDTKPSWKFDCWNPKDSVKRRLEKLLEGSLNEAKAD